MNEEFLHFIWEHFLFDRDELKTERGEKLNVIHAGFRNSESGPDFFNARIRLGSTVWAGNVEIHIRSSDWLKHRHEKDPAYDNVILHVVFEHDVPIFRKDGKVIPTVVLKNKINPVIYRKYRDMQKNKGWIACEKIMSTVPALHQRNWLDKMIASRMEQKSLYVLDKLKFSKNNWSVVFYHILARNFGFHVNAIPFEQLAQSIPLLMLEKHKHNRDEIEALLFGQAGMLKNGTDNYFLKLQAIYMHLRLKYSLRPMNEELWKFMRLRPVNFPTVRLSQFADLVVKSSHLFSRIIHLNRIEEITDLFNCQAGKYWESHYRFCVEAPVSIKKLGNSSVQNIIINTVAPLFYAYGMSINDESFCQKAIQLLEQLPAESNHLMRNWSTLIPDISTAAESQALYYLKTQYCDKSLCLTCGIGQKLVKNFETRLEKS